MNFLLILIPMISWPETHTQQPIFVPMKRKEESCIRKGERRRSSEPNVRETFMRPRVGRGRYRRCKSGKIIERLRK